MKIRTLVFVAPAALFALMLLAIIIFGSPPPPAAQAIGMDGTSLELSGQAPVPSAYRDLVVRAGVTCPEIGPALLAAQIDQESGWNPNAVSKDGAQGISQFMPGTWPTWATDGNNNGTKNPFEPADAIPAQAKMMCAGVQWAQKMVEQGKLTGDPIDLALAAYNCGQGCVLASKGVPTTGQPANYVTKIRGKLPRYATPTHTTTVKGNWALPLAKGSYRYGSEFRTPARPKHHGVDLIAAKGTPIYAASAGTVITVTCNASHGNCNIDGSPRIKGCGWYVDIRHPGGVITRYCHMLTKPHVTVGQTVTAGQQIGIVGTSGNSSGPHLHFEVHTNIPPTGKATPHNATNPQTFMQHTGLTLK